MGGRKVSEGHNDRDAWIRDVSDKRLRRYERMIVSSVKGTRVDGSVRAFPEHFRGLVQGEIKRRGG